MMAVLEWFRTVKKKAYKEHICDLCGEPIVKGCKYVHETQKINGAYRIYKRHIHCDALLEALFNSALKGQDDYDAEEVMEALKEVCEAMQYIGQCPRGDGGSCEDDDVYRCETVQHYMITDPQMRQDARQSVRENARVQCERG